MASATEAAATCSFHKISIMNSQKHLPLHHITRKAATTSRKWSKTTKCSRNLTWDSGGAQGLGHLPSSCTRATRDHPHQPHVGKQPIARWYFPPEVDLPPDAKCLVVWIIEAKVLSKAELQFLALLPSLRPRVRVIADQCGKW